MAQVTFTDILATTIVLVILLNLLEMAEETTLVGWAGAFATFMRRLLSPGLPLVPWPPGDERGKKAES